MKGYFFLFSLGIALLSFKSQASIDYSFAKYDQLCGEIADNYAIYCLSIGYSLEEADAAYSETYQQCLNW